MLSRAPELNIGLVNDIVCGLIYVNISGLGRSQLGAVSLSLIGRANELVLYVIVIDINCGLSAFSLGLIPSLRFVDVWGEVLGFVE